MNSGKIFERDLLSSDSVAKSAKQNLGFSETDFSYPFITTTSLLSLDFYPSFVSRAHNFLSSLHF